MITDQEQRRRRLPDHECSVCGQECGFGQMNAVGGYAWYCHAHLPAGFLPETRPKMAPKPLETAPRPAEIAPKPVKIAPKEGGTGDLFG